MRPEERAIEVDWDKWNEKYRQRDLKFILSALFGFTLGFGFGFTYCMYAITEPIIK